MKKLMILLIVGLSIACSQTKHILSRDNVMYKIKEIYNDQLFDIIYAQKGDSLFKIISLREDTITPHLKALEVGRRYPLKLVQIYPKNNDPKTRIGAKDSCLVGIEKKSHFSLYSATNLNGSFLSESDKHITEIVGKFSIHVLIGGIVPLDEKAYLTVIYIK